MTTPRVVVVEKRTAYRRFVEEERDPRVSELLRGSLLLRGAEHQRARAFRALDF